jgi:hypothetical protein
VRGCPASERIWESNPPAFLKIGFGIVDGRNNDVDEMILGHTDLSDY